MPLTRARQRALRRARPMWGRRQRIRYLRDCDFQFQRYLNSKRPNATT